MISEFAYHVNELNTAVHQNAYRFVFSITNISVTSYDVKIPFCFGVSLEGVRVIAQAAKATAL